METHKTIFYQKLTDTSRKFTPNDQKIIDYLLRNYPNCMLKSATEIASDLGINVSTVTRFYKKIGYKSFRDAQFEFKEVIDFTLSSPLDRLRQISEKTESENLFQRVTDLDITNIKTTFEGLKKESLDTFLDLIVHEPSNVFILSGRSKTLAFAYYLFTQLKFMLPAVHFLKADKLTIADSIDEMKPLDTLIMFSFRRYHNLNQEVATVFKRRGGKVIAFTDSPISPVAQIADLSFTVETKSASPLDSYTAGFSLLNALLGEVSKERSSFLNSKYVRIEELYEDLKIF